jgi:hypothetical protein
MAEMVVSAVPVGTVVPATADMLRATAQRAARPEPAQPRHADLDAVDLRR